MADVQQIINYLSFFCVFLLFVGVDSTLYSGQKQSRTVNLIDNCGKTIHFNNSLSFNLKGSGSNISSERISCVVHLRSNEPGVKLLVHWKLPFDIAIDLQFPLSFDIPIDATNGKRRGSDGLLVRNGRHGSSLTAGRIFGVKKEVTSWRDSSIVTSIKELYPMFGEKLSDMQSSQAQVTFDYLGIPQKDDFLTVITAFRDDVAAEDCTADKKKFRCQGSNMCISSELVCNNQDNCKGNNTSDEPGSYGECARLLGKKCPADFCQNGGSCKFDWNGENSCDCKPDYTGKKCQDYSPAPTCTPGFCVNGGTCEVDWQKQIKCNNCNPGFTGKRCDQTVPGTGDPCKPNPCFNGGTCQTTFYDMDYECICTSGYAGKNCEEVEDEHDATYSGSSDGSGDGYIVTKVTIPVVFIFSAIVIAAIVLRYQRRRRQQRTLQLYSVNFPDQAPLGQPQDQYPNYMPAPTTHAPPHGGFNSYPPPAYSETTVTA